MTLERRKNREDIILTTDQAPSRAIEPVTTRILQRRRRQSQHSTVALRKARRPTDTLSVGNDHHTANSCRFHDEIDGQT